MGVTGATAWRSVGDTTPEAISKAVSRSATKAKSPLATEAAAIAGVGNSRGIGRLIVAMLWMEQKNGTMTAEWGPKPGQFNRLSVKDDKGGWASFTSDAACVDYTVGRLLDPAGPYADTMTLGDLVHRWAPGWDGNDEAAIVQTLCTEIDALPVSALIGAPVEWSPPVYRLDRDYARFGLSQAEAADVRSHRFKGRLGCAPLAIVDHIQDGTTPGSLKWWVGREASSSVMIQRDGSVLVVIDDEDGPWTNGDVASPTGESAAFRAAMGGTNLNCGTLSIEFEAKKGQTLTEPQLASGVWQHRRWRSKFPTIRWELPHSSINSVDRAFCPGSAVMGQLRGALAGSTDAPAAWPVPDEVVAAAFPEARPGQPLTEFWRSKYASQGLFPATRVVTLSSGEKVLVLGTGEVWRWAGGEVVRWAVL